MSNFRGHKIYHKTIIQPDSGGDQDDQTIWTRQQSERPGIDYDRSKNARDSLTLRIAMKNTLHWKDLNFCEKDIDELM